MISALCSEAKFHYNVILFQINNFKDIEALFLLAEETNLKKP